MLAGKPNNGCDLPRGPVIRNLPTSAGDAGLTPESGRAPGEGTGSPLQYSGLEKFHGQGSPWSHRVRDDWARTGKHTWFQYLMAVVWNRVCSISQVCLYLLFSSKNRSAVDAHSSVGESQGRSVRERSQSHLCYSLEDRNTAIETDQCLMG